MSQLSEGKGNLGRLEDFIEVAKAGKRVEMDIELRKQQMIQEIDTGGAHDMHDKIHTYLLIADYIFKVDNELYRLSKVYTYAVDEESLDSIRVNKNIANARLQVDYNRLKAAHISFHEKFF